MSAAAQRTRSQATAAWLVKQGYPHGKRMSGPRPNSGGLTMDNRSGSAAYKRRMENPKNRKDNQ